MATDLPLSCACGRVRGVALGVSPATSNHIVCYCDDSQAFARFLGTPGVMDAHGGTDIAQVSLASVRITQGLDAVECIRLSHKGLVREGTARPPRPRLVPTPRVVDHGPGEAVPAVRSEDGRAARAAAGPDSRRTRRAASHMTVFASNPLERRDD
jgi:hypothetical protein